MTDGTAREIRVVIPFPDRRGRTFGRASQRAAELVVYFEVRVHGIPKAATPAIGARDVSREVSVAS